MSAEPENLSDMARQALACFVPNRERTRPEVSRELGVSKPTVSIAFDELERAGLLAGLRSQQGPTGRAATVYGWARQAGWLLGLDVGSTRVHMVARSIGGRALQRLQPVATDRTRRASANRLVELAADQIRACIDQFTASDGPLRAVAIALPKIVPTKLEPSAVLNSPLGDVDLPRLLDALGVPAGVPVLLENNVNCAALAEMTRGVARGYEDFVYLQIGVGIGAGAVANGRLLRGASGGAGEVSALPFPWGVPGEQPKPLALERYLGSRAFLQRARRSWPADAGRPPASVPALFDRAAAGEHAAGAAVKQHGGEIATLALAIAAVLDPALIVVGGGVGQHPLLTPVVTKAVHRHRPDIEVRASALADHATAEGAITLSAEHALSSLLGSRYHSRLDGRAATLARE